MRVSLGTLLAVLAACRQPVHASLGHEVRRLPWNGGEVIQRDGDDDAVVLRDPATGHEIVLAQDQYVVHVELVELTGVGPAELLQVVGLAMLLGEEAASERWVTESCPETAPWVRANLARVRAFVRRPVFQEGSAR